MKPSTALRVLENITLFSPLCVGWGLAVTDYTKGKPFNPVFVVLALVTAVTIFVVVTTDTSKS